MSVNVSKQRQKQLRDSSTAELLAMIMIDQVERELSVGEVRFVHNIAVERLDGGDTEADELLSQVDSYMP